VSVRTRSGVVLCNSHNCTEKAFFVFFVVNDVRSVYLG